MNNNSAERGIEKLLFAQDFGRQDSSDTLLQQCMSVARCYAHMENSIAVLSDMSRRESYIVFGGVAEEMGMSAGMKEAVVSSIWEEQVLCRIHPHDLEEKHLQEVQFFHFMRQTNKASCHNYHLHSTMRMRDRLGNYRWLLHRIHYIPSESGQAFRFSLCLYNFTDASDFVCEIVNTATGERIDLRRRDCSDVISPREKSVLRLIAKGLPSKEIAAAMGISVNTVNRHRQNILAKLQVQNSIDAVRIASSLHLI